MAIAFEPRFEQFQKDIERLIESEGNCTKNEHGQLVYSGYDAAMSAMFWRYIENRAFAPLVAEFRKWNWEWNYGDQLLELTARLRDARDWPLLRELWAGVIAKRRANYNRTRTAQKSRPADVSIDLVTKTRELLLDSLYRLRSYALELHSESDVAEYLEMAIRVAKGRKA